MRNNTSDAASNRPYDVPTAVTFLLAGLAFGAIFALALVPQIARGARRTPPAAQRTEYSPAL
jgi:HAMP domain-containing protein